MQGESVVGPALLQLSVACERAIGTPLVTFVLAPVAGDVRCKSNRWWRCSFAARLVNDHDDIDGPEVPELDVQLRPRCVDPL